MVVVDVLRRKVFIVFDDVSEQKRIGLTIIIISLLIGAVLTLFLLISGLVTDSTESPEKDIKFVNKYPPSENIAVMKDGSLAYADEYEDTNKSTESTHHPAEVIEDKSFSDYIRLTIYAIAAILIGSKALIDILYVVFPFAFKIAKMEAEKDEEEPVGDDEEEPIGDNEEEPIDDDSRYEWVNEYYRDIE